MLLRARKLRASNAAPATRTNYALASNGGLASASSTFSGIPGMYPASAVNNGDRTGAGWSVTPGAGWNDDSMSSFPDYLTVKFDGGKLIDTVILYTLQDNYQSPIEPTDSTTFSTFGVTGFEVQGWNGTVWESLATVAGSNLVKRTVTFAPYNTDRIRIKINTAADALYSRVVELEAWGVPGVGLPEVGTGVTTTASLVSPNAGTLPFTFGQAFPKGAVKRTNELVVTGVSAYHFDARSSHPDGSLSFAQVSGTYASTANVTTTATITNGAGSAGTPMSSAAILTASPSVSVQCGGLGTITGASLYGSPVRSHHAGSQSVDAMYGTNVGSTSLKVLLFVRLYLGGRVWVQWQVINGSLDDGAGNVDTPVQRTFTLTVTIGGTQTYNASVTMEPHQFIYGDGWIGGDPQVTAMPNPKYLRDTKRSPNSIGYTAPSSTAYDGAIQSYTPFSAPPFKAAMAGPGGSPGIGLEPQWDVLYTSTDTADARAWRACIAGCKHIGAFAFDYRDHTTHRPVKPSAYPQWSLQGNNANSDVATGAGSNFYDFDHGPSVGKKSYLLTANPFYYELCLQNAALNWAMKGFHDGYGTTRIPRDAERGMGWGNIRSIGDAVAIAHDTDDVAAEYKAVLANSIKWLADKKRAGLPMTTLGFLYLYPNDTAGSISTTEGYVQPFMQHYLGIALAQVRDYDLFDDQTDVIVASDCYHQFATMELGPQGDSNAFPFSHATAFYYEKIAATPTSGWYTSGGQVFDVNNGGGAGANASISGNTLLGNSAGHPTEAYEGYWGYLLALNAYSVDHGYPGAAAGRARVEGATNYSEIATSYGWPTEQVWAIKPRRQSPDWYIGMTDWVWKEIPGSAMHGVNPDITMDPPSDPQNRVDDWCSMILNRTTGAMRNPGNGGHADWQGNEIMVNNLLRTGVSSWGWSYERQPTAPALTSTGSNLRHYLDGRKPSSHSYFTPFDCGSFFVCMGSDAVWGSGTVGYPNQLYKYDLTPSINDWIGAGTYPNNALSSITLDAYTKGGMARHPTSGLIYYTGYTYGSMMTFDPSTNVVAYKNSRSGYFAEYRPLSIDTNRQQILCCGNAFSSTTGGVVYDITTDSSTDINFTGPAGVMFGTTYHPSGRNGYGAHYDALMDRHIVKTKVPGEILLVRPGDWHTDTVTTTGGGSQPTIIVNHVICNRFLPLDMPDGRTVYVYVPTEGSNIWVIRPSITPPF